MPVPRILIIGLLTLLAAPYHALASSDEYRQQRALLVLEDFQQSVNLKYRFQDHYFGNGQTSYSHGFQENYNGSIIGSVLNPHFFSAYLSFSLGLNQSIYNSTGKDSISSQALRYNYQFSGSGLDRSITPFTVNSYNSTETVMSPFSPTYTSNSSGTDLRVSLNSELLPSTIGFSHMTLENSGGGNDSSSSSNSFFYSATNNYKDFSTSGVTLSLSAAAADSGQDHRAYSASLVNSLRWGEKAKYTLSSMAQVNETQSNDVPQRIVNLTETFQSRLGKALNLEMIYTFSDNSIVGYSELDTGNTLQKGEMQLTHKLYESLTSRGKGSISVNELLGGTESRYSGMIDFAYIKRLPGQNRLQLNASLGRQVVENKLGSSALTVLNELHPDAFQGSLITLDPRGILTSVISVTSTDPLFTYLEGFDYTVDLARQEIYIEPGGRIDTTGDGTDLRISYTVYVDPLLEYAIDTRILGGSMTFAGGRYSVGASYLAQEMSLIHGPDQNSLRDSSMKRVYLNGKKNRLTYRVSLSESVVGNMSAQSFEGTTQYEWQSSLGRFNFVGSERYSKYDATQTSPAYGENVVTLSVGGVRSISSRTKITLSANAYDSRRDLRSAKDIVSLRGALYTTLNKVTLALEGQTSWNFSEGANTRDDTFTIDFSRTF